ncbi:inositol monophosphatase family protein [Bifidobacterium tsurumiense]|uniref:Inositol monophosphatase n=1 Tax=Bifidobacterium tsurumiense TaxID=356829 RepID=A0A087EFK8_9BIFI|nr:inositol monophosphatase family protein [Bifidobacterium tsurumiense]KFJ06559.1 inositol monophosphatase [Bifidobacterium tsurumiense]MDY4677288.1 inositol monophosphatase family protein [Bifidobacterium tsurumiense]MSS12874.1 inositol monophosphatase family protein [Bifidobacterium tsurumiense]
MNLQEMALEVLRIVQEAGTHAFRDQLTPRSMRSLDTPVQKDGYSSDIDGKLVPFIENRLTYINPFNGQWRDRPEHCNPGERYWCVGNVDGVINFRRNMAEWALTVSLFEFNEEGSAQPILGVVHAPALGITYLAAKGSGAIRIRRTPVGDKREKIIPSTTPHLEGSVVCYGMSFIPEESTRALRVVSSIAGKPADIKRIGPASLDLCKVADGTYDAYFEPHLHTWDLPAVSAATVVVWEAQGRVQQWNGNMVHWRQDNDIVASNGIISDQLEEYLR